MGIIVLSPEKCVPIEFVRRDPFPIPDYHTSKGSPKRVWALTDDLHAAKFRPEKDESPPPNPRYELNPFSAVVLDDFYIGRTVVEESKRAERTNRSNTRVFSHEEIFADAELYWNTV